MSNDITELMREYFDLKDQDRAIREVRNDYMAEHHCLNIDRPSTDFADQSDYEENGGECIRREVGMGGYPAPMCEVCEKRNAWYLERQRLSHRRATLIRKVKRIVRSAK